MSPQRAGLLSQSITVVRCAQRFLAIPNPVGMQQASVGQVRSEEGGSEADGCQLIVRLRRSFVAGPISDPCADSCAGRINFRIVSPALTGASGDH